MDMFDSSVRQEEQVRCRCCFTLINLNNDNYHKKIDECGVPYYWHLIPCWNGPPKYFVD